MAKEHPRYANMEWPEHEFQEYPKTVYPAGVDPTIQAVKVKRHIPGNKYQVNHGVVVHNQAEEELVMSGGTIQRESDSLEDLRGRLRNLDPTVQIDKRWGATKLQGLIDEKEAELNE